MPHLFFDTGDTGCRRKSARRRVFLSGGLRKEYFYDDSDNHFGNRSCRDSFITQEGGLVI